MSERPRRRRKNIDYARLNSIGIAGSEDEAVVETLGNDVAQATEKPRQMESETTGDAEEAADELTEAEIDAKLALAKKEQEDLAAQIQMQKKLQVLCDLERENQRLRDELTRVTDESDGGRSLLHAPSGARQQSSEVKSGHERKHTQTKVKARPTAMARKSERDSVRNITDLRRNLTLYNEADQALSVLGVPLSVGPAAESSDSRAVESDGPRHRVAKASKSKRNKLKSKSHNSTKRASAVYEGWDRQGLSDRLHGGELSDCDEGGILWPNENLGPRYNNFGKADTKFRQLDMRMLVAGELNIVCNCGVSVKEREARLRLLSDINFYSAHYQWPALLKFHAAVLSEVEKGQMQWGDDHSGLEQQMLMPFPLTKGKTECRQEKGVNAAPKVTNGGGKADDRILYCAEYQNDLCQLHDSPKFVFADYEKTRNLY